MAMSRGKIAEIIEGPNAGDLVKVGWRDGVNESIETGKVWEPTDSEFFGLGPDLLDPADENLVSIVVTKKNPIVVPEPAVGSVAVWYTENQTEIVAAKRRSTGWYRAGGGQRLPWGIFILAYGEPVQVFTPGKRRRLSRDFERTTAASVAWMSMSFQHMMAARLAA